MKLKLMVCIAMLCLASCSTKEKFNAELDIVKEEVIENNPITNPEPKEVVPPQTEESNPIDSSKEKEARNDKSAPEATPKEEETPAPQPNENVTPQNPTPTPTPEPTPEPTPPPTPEPPIVTPETTYLSAVEQAIFTLVNQERAKAGVPALGYSQVMQKYARIKSQDMGVKGYFDHKDPQGRLITDQMAADGVTYQAWGENIAYIGGSNDANALANQFMTNWMNSSGHRENILSTNFTEIGIGVYQTGNTIYATQEFYR